MLQLTKKTEYGLIALVHLAGRGDEFVSAREICDHYPIPRRLVAEVLKDLCRVGLVDSQRGAGGGYTLARPSGAISLAEVVEALEGAPTLTSCEQLSPARGGICDVEPTCPIRSPIHTIREHIWELMRNTPLSSLAQPRKLGKLALMAQKTHP